MESPRFLRRCLSESLFYVLRPLFACRWILQTESQPPTEFEKLTRPVWAQERDWIENLLLQKSRTVETGPVQVDQVRAEAVRSELERYKSAAELVAASRKWSATELDKILREWIEKRSGI